MSEEHPDLTLAYMTGYAKGRAVAERDAKDAARWRKARQMVRVPYPMGWVGLTDKEVDAIVDVRIAQDAAMSAESREAT